MRLEGLSELKKSSHLFGNQTRDLPACGIVPQPTTLSHATLTYKYIITIFSTDRAMEL
jgi:hypothetical protein